jgi:HEAT repeat protein
MVLCGCTQTPPPTLSGGKPVAYWLKALQSADAKARQEAVFKLGNVGSADPSAYPAVFGALKDSSAKVRREAVLSLMKFGDEARDAAPALRELERDPDATVRAYAAKALAKFDKPAEGSG